MHQCINLIFLAIIIVRNKQSKQKTYEVINRTTRTKMSGMINKGVNISCSAVTTQFCIVAGLLVEIIKTIAKTKVYILECTTIR